MRNMLFILLLLLFTGCSAGGPERGRVESIEFEPPNPAAGTTVDVEVALHDPYVRPAIEGAEAMVEVSVTGGTLNVTRWNGTRYVPASGANLTDVSPGLMRWDLPETPGTFTISVTFDGHTLTRNLSTD
jgi:hypothetical protein